MDAVVVCGLGRFGLQVVEGLRGCGCPVTVVSDADTNPERIDRAEAAGARIVRGDFRTHAVRREAEIARARAVVLTTASDVANLEAALEIRGAMSSTPRAGSMAWSRTGGCCSPPPPRRSAT